VWVAGVRSLWRSGRPLWQALVWAYGLLFVFFALTTGAKIYYLAGAYVYLLAAGAVRIEGSLVALRGRLRHLMTWTRSAPRLRSHSCCCPAGRVHRLDLRGQRVTARDGRLARAGPLRSHGGALPAGGPARHAVIFTADYGEAGAINELGRSAGLPIAVSGQNNEWFWGPALLAPRQWWLWRLARWM